MGLRAFENRVKRRIFGPKRDKVTGEWRRLHNKEVYDIYTSTNINQVVKSRRELVRVCSTYGGEEICIQGFGGKHEGKRHLKDPGVDGRIILKWIFEKSVGVHELDRSGSGQGEVMGSCEYGNECSGSIKRGKFLGWVRIC